MADISMVNIVLWLPDGMLHFGQFLNATLLHPKMNKIEYTVGEPEYSAHHADASRLPTPYCKATTLQVP